MNDMEWTIKTGNNTLIDKIGLLIQFYILLNIYENITKMV